MKNIQKSNNGFGLIEILVSILVLAIGLLGLAGLQATSLKQNHGAFIRSQATQLAYDIADRMRANKVASSSYLTADPSTSSIQATCTVVAGSCTPTQMAENDLYEWSLMLIGTLPVSESSISRASDIYTVTINWDDNRDGIVDGNDPDFQVSFSL